MGFKGIKNHQMCLNSKVKGSEFRFEYRVGF